VTFVFTIEPRTIAFGRLPSRLAARIITGPIGFFVAGVIDWLALLGHYLRARVAGRDPWE
jgi:hypothetical protein